MYPFSETAFALEGNAAQPGHREHALTSMLTTTGGSLIVASLTHPPKPRAVRH